MMVSSLFGWNIHLPPSCLQGMSPASPPQWQAPEGSDGHGPVSSPVYTLCVQRGAQQQQLRVHAVRIQWANTHRALRTEHECSYYLVPHMVFNSLDFKDPGCSGPTSFTSAFGVLLGFPGDASGKEPGCQCRRDVRDAGLIPRLGRSPGGGHGTPLQYSCLENPTDRGAWRATGHGVAESDTTERLSFGVLSRQNTSLSGSLPPHPWKPNWG